MSVALHLAAVGLIIQASNQTLRDRAPPKEAVVFLADIQPAEPPPALEEDEHADRDGQHAHEQDGIGIRPIQLRHVPVG
ncbi:MAG: hypothetical protein KJ740_06485, partial [Gammaproteobacteria bacterium]|nr:hypothetical protein [Gammaproteobacteria bacterium]